MIDDHRAQLRRMLYGILRPGPDQSEPTWKQHLATREQLNRELFPADDQEQQ